MAGLSLTGPRIEVFFSQGVRGSDACAGGSGRRSPPSNIPRVREMCPFSFYSYAYSDPFISLLCCIRDGHFQ